MNHARQSTAGSSTLQGDRAFDGAEIQVLHYSNTEDELLQGDRAFDGAEILVEAGADLVTAMLQGDRAFDGAEMAHGLKAGQTIRLASMRPRLGWRGNPPLSSPLLVGISSFNETAPLMARKS